MKKENKIVRAIYDAKKEKATIRLNIRLLKNGQFSSVEGTVQDLKVNLEGNPYVLIKPRGNKHMQSVHLNNVLAVVKGDVIYKR